MRVWLLCESKKFCNNIFAIIVLCPQKYYLINTMCLRWQLRWMRQSLRQFYFSKKENVNMWGGMQKGPYRFKGPQTLKLPLSFLMWQSSTTRRACACWSSYFKTAFTGWSFKAPFILLSEIYLWFQGYLFSYKLVCIRSEKLHKAQRCFISSAIKSNHNFLHCQRSFVVMLWPKHSKNKKKLFNKLFQGWVPSDEEGCISFP